MDEKIVQRFRQKHESLAGIVHLVSGMEEAVEKVIAVLRQKEAGTVALGELPDEFRQTLEQRGSESGLNLLAPPYRNADLPAALDSVQAGVSWAAFAIAETGALVEFATDDAYRLVSALPLVHIGLFRADDIVENLMDAAAPIRNFYNTNPGYATASFISGPSRTADIEMRLILGVHGPAETHAVIVQ
jgi:L-lactate dehydrogenase complex protein LldG